MQSSFASARRYQIAFAILLAVCLAQVGWWMLDQWLFSGEVRERLEEAHRRNLDAAEVMLRQGDAPENVAAMFPALTLGEDGVTLRVDPAIVAALDAERDSRRNRYAWEGGFFLIVLSAAIGVLWRAVRTEVRLRRRQHASRLARGWHPGRLADGRVTARACDAGLGACVSTRSSEES